MGFQQFHCAGHCRKLILAMSAVSSWRSCALLRPENGEADDTTSERLDRPVLILRRYGSETAPVAFLMLPL